VDTMNIDIAQLKFVDETLREIVLDIEEFTGLTFTITSLYREGDPSSSVHSTMPVRGCDFRCRVQTLGDEIARIINSRWLYDPKRPYKSCAICHDTGKGLHLHIQSHPNTVRR